MSRIDGRPSAVRSGDVEADAPTMQLPLIDADSRAVETGAPDFVASNFVGSDFVAPDLVAPDLVAPELAPDRISPIAAIELAEDRANSAPDSDPLGSQVRRGALWSALSTLLFKVANIAILSVVVRELTPKDFGVFAVAVTVHTIISSFAELGISSCLVRADVDVDKIAPTVATLSMISSGILTAIMVVFARPLAGLVGSEDAAGPMRVMAIAVLMVGLFAVPSAETSRNFRQDQQFIAQIFGFIPANVLLLFLAHNGDGAMSFAWSRVLGQGLTGAALIYFAKDPYRFGFARSQLRYLLAFGLPLAGANLLNYILLNADYALVGRLLGSTRLGLYVLAFNVASWSTGLLSSMINGVGMTAFSRVKGDAERLQRALAKATAAIGFVALPVCGLTLSLAPDLIRTVYGAQWGQSAPVLTILCLYGALSLFCLLLANVLSGMGHTRALFIVQVAWLAALVPAMVIGVHVGGIVGAAWAHIVIVVLVATPVYLVMLKRSSRVNLLPLIPAIMPALLGSAVAAALAFVGTHIVTGSALRLIVGLILGGVAYIAVAAPSMLPLINSLSALPGVIVRPLERYVLFLGDVTGAIRPSRYRTSGRHRLST